jgi:hypothetical protein
MRFGFTRIGSLFLMAILGFTAIGSLAAEPAKKTPNKETDDLRAKVAELEKRVAALEEQLRTAGIAKIARPGMIEFGVIVAANMCDPQTTRYIKCKVVISVDPTEEKAIGELARNKSADLRTWLIAHLSEQSIADFSGAKGQQKLREDIRREFNSVLFPGQAQGKIRDILFDEFTIQ